MSYSDKKIIKWILVFFGFSFIYYLFKNDFFKIKKEVVYPFSKDVEEKAKEIIKDISSDNDAK